jgi:hypothetical protein
MTPPLEVEAVLCGAVTTSDDDSNHVVHALNERFAELGRDHRVPYSSLSA